MGDFAASDLTRADGLYPDHAGQPCAGCNGRIDPDDRCYANGAHIWHSGCWPSTDGGLESLIRHLGRWKDPQQTVPSTFAEDWDRPDMEAYNDA